MSTKAVRIRSEAQQEINAAFEFYFDRNRNVAEAFLTEVGAAIKAIAEHPQLYSVYTKNTRKRLLDGFPFSVIFKEANGNILVVALAHAKRRPGYWTKRV